MDDEKASSSPEPSETTTESAAQIIEEEEGETKWKSIAIAGVFACLASLENTVIGIAEWPYMHKMDPDATSEFFGLSSSLSRVAHAIFAVLFSAWTYKTQQIRAPLIAGRVLALITCCIYLCVELIPSGRRFLMMSCYILFGIATSSPTVLRVFMISVSTKKDRSRAYAALVLANWLAVVIGPVCQLIFSAVSYPGTQIFPGMRFHIYSAPIWMAGVIDIITIPLIYFFLSDMPKSRGEAPSLLPLRTLISRIKSLRHLDLKWSLIAVLWVQRVVANLSVVTLMALTSPLLMVVYGWDGEYAVWANSISSTGVGVLALIVASTFMFTPFTKYVSPRITFTVSLFISLGMYVISFPYPGIDHPVPPYNETTGAGCDPSEYSWCDWATGSWPWVFMAVAAVQTGVGLPTAQISLDTIYSHILRNVDQNLLQGAFVAFEDLIYMVGPIYATSMFTAFGQRVLWISNAVVEILGLLLWLYFARKTRDS